MNSFEIDILRWLVITALGGVMYFMKRNMDRQDAEQKESQRQIQEIKEKYLHKDDFKEFKIELKSWFDEIKQDLRDLKK